MGTQINLVAAWIGISLGFASGMVMGLFFHREQWLGGYAGLKRRLYRLAHISFFGLGAVNLCFFLTAKAMNLSGPMILAASWCFLLGAISMPVCCIAMAHRPRVLPLFAVPVLSLIIGGALTLTAVVPHTNSASPPRAAIGLQESTLSQQACYAQ